jgi:hypothetical protein
MIAMTGKRNRLPEEKGPISPAILTYFGFDTRKSPLPQQNWLLDGYK